MRVERILTADGSWTLRDLDRDLSFRSVHGAESESEHVFVTGSGIDDRAVATRPWRVLELGFGAGLNFHRTRLRALTTGVHLDYVALERDPVPSTLLRHDPDTDHVLRLALATPGRPVDFRHGRLTIHVCDWRAAPSFVPGFDAVYHDPFGPEVDGAAWSEECFRWSRDLVARDGRLLTYSVAGHVRRALSAAGWEVRKRPGPGRKREVLWALTESDAGERQQP